MQKFLILILSLVLLGSCTPVQVIPPTEDILSPSPQLVITSTPRPSFTKTPVQSEEPKILPTSTPMLYTVELNDTLTGIALKFNISLEELVAANPSIGSQALTVGLVLVIPPQQETDSEPTATPLPVTVQQSLCYQNRDNSMWCLVLLKNELADVLQNLSIKISIFDSNGKFFGEQTAYAPLDLLPSGESIVLGALFKDPIPTDYTIQTQILSASRLPAADKHYLYIHFQNNLSQVNWDGKSARVSGQVALDKQSDTANRIWILAMAYDISGNIVGFRRWESNGPLSPEDFLSFDFEVSSLGVGIDHIDLMVEAVN